MARGDSLGEAVLGWLTGEAGRYSTYDRKGWHAQLTQLRKTERGREAMRTAGISVTPRTVSRWVSRGGRGSTFRPQPANVAKIHRAYDLAARKDFPLQAVKSHTFEITGVVATGEGRNRDERHRGSTGYAPLRIDGARGSWTRMQAAWNDGTLDARTAEALFIEDVIGGDIGDGSAGGWEFPGTTYQVT